MMRDLIKFSFSLVLSMAALLIVFVVPLNFYGAYQCNQYQLTTGTETRYVQFDSCYVNKENAWLRWDEYMQRGIAAEGLKAAHD